MFQRKHAALLLAALTALLLIVPVANADDTNVADAPAKAEQILNMGMDAIKDVLAAPDDQETVTSKVKKMSLLSLIHKGGIVGYLIILLSIVSVGLIIDYTFTIRKSKMIPSKDIKKLKALINERNLEGLAKFEKSRASFLSKVVVAGLRESHMGYHAMIKSMEDALDALSGNIARRTEHLNVIGNITPMLGLLGTVIGMLRCFNEISHVSGAIDPKQLAGGIFEALVTTCMGLMVAIPSLYCYAIFKNRVEEYTSNASQLAENLAASFRTNSDA